MYSKSSIPSEDITPDHSQNEAAYAKLSLNGDKSLIVGCIYRPPSNNLDYVSAVCDFNETIASRTPMQWCGLVEI